MRSLMSRRWVIAGLLAGFAMTLALAIRRGWRAVASLAEELSDAGHGPARWVEGRERIDPYAGSGPDAPRTEPGDAED